MKVGFLGLGRMGAGMARNLLAAGHEVTVYNRTAERARPLLERGARAAAQVADACRGEAVVNMLADDIAVEEVVFGDRGVLRNLPRGAIHVSMSTIGTALSGSLAVAHAGAGQGYVAAPVFGRPEAAAAGELAIIVAGKDESVETCLPLLEAMGRRVFRVGEEPAAANLVKLSGNLLIATVIEALGEALALVAKGGVDRGRYLEILTSTLFGCPVYANYGRMLVEGEFQPAGFTAALGEKDVRLALAAAQELRAPLPLAGLLHDRFLRLLAAGGEELDWSALGQLAAQDAGQAGPPLTAPPRSS